MSEAIILTTMAPARPSRTDHLHGPALSRSWSWPRQHDHDGWSCGARGGKGGAGGKVHVTWDGGCSQDRSIRSIFGVRRWGLKWIRRQATYGRLRRPDPVGEGGWRSSHRQGFLDVVAAASLSMDWSKSAARTNMRGDRGSPCLTPFLHRNCLPGTPLSRTEEYPVL